MAAGDTEIGPRVVLALCLTAGGIAAILMVVGVVPPERAAGGMGLLAFIGLGCQQRIVKRLEHDVAALRSRIPVKDELAASQGAVFDGGP